jgi:hypothetical protein
MAGNTGSRVLNKIASKTVTDSGAKSKARTIDPLDSSVTLVDGSVVTVKEAVNSFIRFDLQEKSAKEQKAEAAEVVKLYAGKMRDENAVNGDYQKTYRILGSKTKAAQHAADISQSDKFSIPKKNDDIEALKKILGDDFGSYLERDISISIKPEVLKNRKLRADLSKRLAESFGAELSNFFVKEEIWTSVKGIDQRQYELEENQRTQMREKLKPAADSIKNTSYTE